MRSLGQRFVLACVHSRVGEHIPGVLTPGHGACLNSSFRQRWKKPRFFCISDRLINRLIYYISIFQLINGFIAACDLDCGLCLTVQVTAASLVRGRSLGSVGGGLFTLHTEWRVGHPEGKREEQRGRGGRRCPSSAR